MIQERFLAFRSLIHEVFICPDLGEILSGSDPRLAASPRGLQRGGLYVREPHQKRPLSGGPDFFLVCFFASSALCLRSLSACLALLRLSTRYATYAKPDARPHARPPRLREEPALWLLW